jgi:uncharacterized protein YnzC (UPF0291/DUF896 family)
MAEDESQTSEAQTLQSLLDRINALEIYVTAQDQRISYLEAELQQANNPSLHHTTAADPIIQDLQAKIKSIEATTPKASYRDATAKGIPDLASAVIKEQAERSKRSKTIVIRDNNEAISQSPATLLQDITTWLGTHGLSPDDTAGLSARLIPRKPSPSTLTAAPSSAGITIIVTLPSIIDRLPIIAKLKRSVRSTPSCHSIYVDPDLTPAEAKEQQALRQERNRLNAERNDEDIRNYHFGIRSGRVVKLQH